MNRQERHNARRRMATDEEMRMLLQALGRLGIPAERRDGFIHWSLQSLWEEYNRKLMDQKTIIENQVRQLQICLPNGTVGKTYFHEFDLPASVSGVELLGLEGTGLLFTVDESNHCSVIGRPSAAGDFRLTLTYNTVQGMPSSQVMLPVAFNPNPRTLWKNIPTDRDIMYYKEDAVTEYQLVGDDGTHHKDMVAASVRGRSHAQEGRPRDDHFKLFHCPASDWYIMAVADGAGSARFSRKGSEIACETAVNHCKEQLLDNPLFEDCIRSYYLDRDDDAKRGILTQMVYNIIFRAAEKAQKEITRISALNPDTKVKDYATTLMFAICKKFDFGWFIASFWVGDGAICIYNEKDGTAKLLGVPDEGEFSGQTRFLTMPEILREPSAPAKRLRMSIVEDFTALYLMTDGVSDPMFETERNLNDPVRWAEFTERLRTGFPDDGIPGVDLSDNNPEAAQQLLRWLDFWSPGNHDDRTIAILY